MKYGKGNKCSDTKLVPIFYDFTVVGYMPLKALIRFKPTSKYKKIKNG
jgi:hypothetical protein